MGRWRWLSKARVELQFENLESQQAAQRLGFSYEDVFEQATSKSTNKDTV